MKELFYALLLVCIWKGALAIADHEEQKRKNKYEAIVEKLEKEYFLRHPWVVLSQMIHETGKFSSPIWKENHNGVGMKWNKRGYATGVNRGHAKYSCVEDCLKDYSDWQGKYCPDSIRTDSQYVHWLVKFGYAEDKTYSTHILRTLSTIKKK